MPDREAFLNIYAQGMARVATATPRVFPGDPKANAEATAAMAAAAHEAGAAVLVCPGLGITGYAIDDLLQQDVVLDAAERAVETLIAASIDWTPVVTVGGESDIAPTLLQNSEAGDVVVCLGAGSITDWSRALPDALALQQAGGAV